MESTPVPEGERDTGGIVTAARHEDTLRIRIPAPLPEPALALAPPSRRGAIATVVSALTARLEVPRWLVGSLSALMFSGGLLLAASVAGGPGTARAGAASTRAAAAPDLPAPTSRATLALPAAAPSAAPGPVVEPLPPARPAAAAAAGHADPPRRAPHPAPATTTATRRPRLAAVAKPPAPPSTWVDPFAE